MKFAVLRYTIRLKTYGMLIKMTLGMQWNHLNVDRLVIIGDELQEHILPHHIMVRVSLCPGIEFCSKGTLVASLASKAAAVLYHQGERN